MIEPSQALKIILESAGPLAAGTVSLTQAANHVLAQDIVAGHDVPPFNNSAMDGYALLAADIAGANETDPVRLRLIEEQPAGQATDVRVVPGTAIKIMTGAPVPEGADTVVPFERTKSDTDHVAIMVSLDKQANIRLAGEDMPKGALIFKSGQLITPVFVGLLASLGYAKVKVVRRPKVAVIGTGNELIPVEAPLEPGKIRDSNSYAMAAQTRETGAPVERLGVAGDTKEEVQELIEKALKTADVIVTSGGVSVGDYDYVKDVLAEMGADLKFWGVKQKPGKPLAFWTIGPKLVFGLPGNPVASVLCFEEYVRPALLKMMGRRELLRPVVRAQLTHDVSKKSGRQHFVGMVVTPDGPNYRAEVNGRQGSGILKSLAGADGLGVLPKDATVLKAGETIEVQLIRQPEDH